MKLLELHHLEMSCPIRTLLEIKGWGSCIEEGGEGYRQMWCSFFCGASVASEQHHNQDLKRIYKREYEVSDSSLLECTALLFTIWSALRYEQHEDVIPSFGVDSSDKFCSDLPVKPCEGDRN